MVAHLISSDGGQLGAKTATGFLTLKVTDASRDNRPKDLHQPTPTVGIHIPDALQERGRQSRQFALLVAGAVGHFSIVLTPVRSTQDANGRGA